MKFFRARWCSSQQAQALSRSAPTASTILPSSILSTLSPSPLLRPFTQDPQSNLISPPSYLGDESDKHALIKSVRFILRLARTAPLSDSLDLRTLSAPPPNPDFYWPGDADPDALSDEDIVKFIRKNAQSPWHPVSALLFVVSKTY